MGLWKMDEHDLFSSVIYLLSLRLSMLCLGMYPISMALYGTVAPV